MLVSMSSHTSAHTPAWGSHCINAGVGRSTSMSLHAGVRVSWPLCFMDAISNIASHFVERIFYSYVRPLVCFGLEFVPQGAQTRRFQARVNKNGVDVCSWAAWQPTASLCVRLLCLPSHCFAAQIAQCALNQPRSWVREVLTKQRSACLRYPIGKPSHFGKALAPHREDVVNTPTSIMFHYFKNAAPSSSVRVGNPGPPYTVLSTNTQLKPIERDTGG